MQTSPLRVFWAACSLMALMIGDSWSSELSQADLACVNKPPLYIHEDSSAHKQPELASVLVRVVDEHGRLVNDCFVLHNAVQRSPFMGNQLVIVPAREKSDSLVHLRLRRGSSYGVSGYDTIGPSQGQWAFDVLDSDTPQAITIVLMRGSDILVTATDVKGQRIRGCQITADLVDEEGQDIAALKTTCPDSQKNFDKCDQTVIRNVPAQGRMRLEILAGDPGQTDTIGLLDEPRPIRSILELPITTSLVFDMSQTTRQMALRLLPPRGGVWKDLEPQSIQLVHLETGTESVAWYAQDGLGYWSDRDSEALPLGVWQASTRNLTYKRGLATSLTGFALIELTKDFRAKDLPLVQLPRLTIKVVAGDEGLPLVGTRVSIQSESKDPNVDQKWAGHDDLFRTNAQGEVSVYTTIGPKLVTLNENRGAKNIQKRIVVTTEDAVIELRAHGPYVAPAANTRVVVDGFGETSLAPRTNLYLIHADTGAIVEVGGPFNHEPVQGPLSMDLYLPPTDSFFGAVMVEGWASPIVRFVPSGLARPVKLTVSPGIPVTVPWERSPEFNAWSDAEEREGGLMLVAAPGIPVAHWSASAELFAIFCVILGIYRLCWFGG